MIESIREQTETTEIKRLQKDTGEKKVEIESTANSSVTYVRQNVEETLEIERWKCKLIIHRRLETDAEKDVECVVEIMNDSLHMDFTRHAVKMERIGRLVQSKPRPLRVMLVRLDAIKEILTRLKTLKDVEKLKKVSSRNLSRKREEKKN